MPTYEYEHTKGIPEDCQEVIEVRQMMADEPLTKCPVCGRAVQRIISRVAGHVGTMGQANIEEKGFKRFVKRDKGVYERG